MKFLHTLVIVAAACLFIVAGFLLSMWLYGVESLWLAVLAALMGAILTVWAWERMDLEFEISEETKLELARQRNLAKAEAARLDMKVRTMEQAMKHARLLNCHAAIPVLLLAAGTADATYYSGWDKVGAVAVCVLMLGVLVLLHRSGLKRVDAISDRHMAFVEKQTEVLTELHGSNEQVVESTRTLHRRIDAMLTCHKPACPLKAFQSANSEDVTLHSKPQPPTLPS